MCFASQLILNRMNDSVEKIIKKYNSLSKPLKAALWFTVCNFALKGISFFCIPIYARLLSTDEYGKMSVIVSYESIFNIFATFELSLGAYQRGLLKYKDDVDMFEQSIVLLSNLLTIAFTLLIVLFWRPFSGFTGFSLSIFLLMMGYFIVFTPYNCWLNRKRFAYDYKAAVAVTLSMALISNLCPIITLNLLGKTSDIKVGSTLLASILICFPFWAKNCNFLELKKYTERVKNYFSYALKFQGPLVFHSLSYYVLNQSDRVMIGHLTNNTSAAYYSVAYSLANVIIIFQNSLNQVLKPWRFQKLEGKNYKDVRDISNAVIVIVGAVIVFFSLLVPSVLKLMFKPEYYEAVQSMAPVAFSVYFLFLYTIFVDVESYYGKTNYIAYVSVFCAVLNVVLNYIGIQLFGYTACAYTTLFCYIIMAFLHYGFMYKTCKEAEIKEIPVDIRFIVLFSSVMMMLFVAVSFCYYSTVIRYIACMFILIAGIWKRKDITTIIGKLTKGRKS